MIIYHGSERIIDAPVYGGGRIHNDYGSGFYCTESVELAKEWSVGKLRDGYVNKYDFDTDSLNVLDLSRPQYTILHWLTILLQNRSFDVQSDFGREALRYLTDTFAILCEDYDVIRGYRADDSYFSFAQDFLNNQISLQTLSRVMRLGELGEQIMLKSRRAFESIHFQDAEVCDSSIWYPKRELREQRAKQTYKSLRSEHWTKGNIYMMTILDEEMKADDARLRC